MVRCIVTAILCTAAWTSGLDISVVDYGAVEGVDGCQDSTHAFRRALADLAAAGGGVLRVPPGDWYIRPLNVTSHLVLWLASGATLHADTDRAHIPVLPALPSWGPTEGSHFQRFLRKQADLRDAVPRFQALLWGAEVENVTITGENGTIDGSGSAWWSRWLNEPLLGRPHLIQLQDSKGIVIRNVTLRNAGFWTAHFWRCEFVTVQFLTILVEPWDPPLRPTNTDGVNPDSSSHVLIEDSYFQTGDDAVAVKSGWDCFGRQVGMPSRNITIRRVTVRQTRGCNAAAITVGSEMSGGVEDVVVEDCHVVNAGVAVEIKVGAARGGFVRRVAVRRLQVAATMRAGLVVMATYPEANPFCSEVSPPAPLVSDISFEDVAITGPSQGPLVNFQGTREVFMENITVRRLHASSGSWTCNQRISGHAEDVSPRACKELRAHKGLLLRKTRQPRRPEEQEEWRNDGRCGDKFLVRGGLPGRCPTPAEFEAASSRPERQDAEDFLANAPCCSSGGWCGVEAIHCTCSQCVDFRRGGAKALPAAAEESVSMHAPSTSTREVPAWLQELVKEHDEEMQRRSSSRARPPTHAPPRAEPVAQVMKRRQEERREQRLQQLQAQETADSESLQTLGAGLVMWYSVPFLGCIYLLRRCVPGLNKLWCCRIPHIYLWTLLLLSLMQCVFMVLRQSRSPPSPASKDLAPSVAHFEEGGLMADDAQAAGADDPRPVAAEASLGVPEITGSSSASSSRSRPPSCHRGASVTPLDFGARGDGVADDSKAVLAALFYGSTCSARVVIGPQKMRFLVMPSSLQLPLEDVTVVFDGFLVGPSLPAWNPTLASWPKGSCAYGEAGCSKKGMPSPEYARSQWALLHFKGARNVTLLGHGLGGVAGSGQSFWAVRNSRPEVRGYCLLKLENSKDIRVSGLTLRDSPMYQVVVAKSSAVILEGLQVLLASTVLGDSGAHNTDGVSIIGSSGVQLRNSVIESGDDNVVVKEASRDIQADSLVLRRGKGVSIGSLGERGAEDQVVADVFFHNISLDQSMHGARIKTWKGAHGLVRNVTFNMFRLNAVKFGILVDQTYCPPSQRPEGCPEGQEEAIRIQDVSFTDFAGTYITQDRKVLCVRCTGLSFEKLDMTPAAPTASWQMPPAARPAVTLKRWSRSR